MESRMTAVGGGGLGVERSRKKAKGQQCGDSAGRTSKGNNGNGKNTINKIIKYNLKTKNNQN